MKVLVTGSTGFIGRYLVNALVEKNYEVRCLVRKTSPLHNFQELGVDLIYGDILETDSLLDAVRDINIVYHLAAIRGDTPIPIDKYWEVNVQGVKNILDVSCNEGVDQFVYISTIGVLGWVSNPPANETYPLNPIGKYHLTKCEGEKLVLDAYQDRRLPITIIRPVMTYGLEADGFLYNLTRLIKNGRFMTIGNGRNYLHLVNIENLIQSLLLVASNPKAIGETYIIADEQPIMFNRLTEIIANSLNANVSKVHIPVWLAKLAAMISESTFRVIRNKSEPPITSSKVDLLSKHRFYDISKAGREINYRPLISTEDGVKQAVEHFTKNEVL